MYVHYEGNLFTLDLIEDRRALAKGDAVYQSFNLAGTQTPWYDANIVDLIYTQRLTSSE